MNNRVLYQEKQAQFISDVERNFVSQKMRHNAELAGIHSAENEIASWENNAPHIARLLTQCGAKDSYVTFEFLVPFSRKRIDCMIYGTGEDNSENVIHIELKQWGNKSVGVADSDGNFTTDDAANRQPDDIIFNVDSDRNLQAAVAQSVERRLGKAEVSSSSLVSSFSVYLLGLSEVSERPFFQENAVPLRDCRFLFPEAEDSGPSGALLHRSSI